MPRTKIDRSKISPKVRRRINFDAYETLFEEREREKKCRRQQKSLQLRAAQIYLRANFKLERPRIQAHICQEGAWEVPLFVELPVVCTKEFALFLSDLSSSFPDQVNNRTVEKIVSGQDRSGLVAEILDLSGSVDEAVELGLWAQNKGYENYFVFHPVKRGLLLPYMLTFTLVKNEIIVIDPAKSGEIMIPQGTIVTKTIFFY